MRRWLSLLLLIMLPLQANWAALAAYCQHEQDRQTAHWGHHVHQHSEPTLSAASASAQSSGVHLDCDGCLATLLLPLLSEPALWTIWPASPRYQEIQTHPLFRPAAPPERPDRSIPASG